MTRKPAKRPPDDPEQYKRFLEASKKAEASDDPKALDKALKKIDAETSDYYILGYSSTNPDPLKRTRKIEVKVKRPEMRVISRTSYSLKPNQAPKP